MKIILPFVFILVSCGKIEPKKVIYSQELPKRYTVSQQEPLALFDDIVEMEGVDGDIPFTILLTKKGDIYQDDNLRLPHKSYTDIEERLGLGPTFTFTKIAEETSQDMMWFDKPSMVFSYENNKIKRDYNPLIKEEWADKLLIKYSRENVKCDLTGGGVLYCWGRDIYGAEKISEKKRVWGDTQNPIMELSITTNGAYALSKDGRLWYFDRFFETVQHVNKGIHFLKNSRGRYFIHARANYACLQSEGLSLYCLDHNDLGEYLEHEVLVHPHLKKVLDPDFKVEEVAYSGYHSCFLSQNGDVFCQGNNLCGQINGRYNPERPEGESRLPLQKVHFLEGPGKQIFTYAGGTCVLLKSGRLQCFGLGASVKRKKNLPLSDYLKSFSYFHGFRPHHICAGGAEDGV